MADPSVQLIGHESLHMLRKVLFGSIWKPGKPLVVLFESCILIFTRPRVKEPAKGILLEAEGSTLPEDMATGKTKDISKEVSSDQSAQDYLSSSSPGETASKAAASPDAGGGVQVPVGPSLSTPEGRARTPRGSPKHGPFVKDTSPPTIDLSDGFHVFTWLNMEEPMIATTAGSRSLSPDPPGARSGRKMVVTVNEEDLYADLEEMDRFLAQKTGLIERLAYKECRPRTRSEVYDLIFKEGKDITGSKTKDEKKRKDYENKVEIVNKTESLFQFFLPCKFEGPTVGKFWGAVYQLLVVSVNPIPVGIFFEIQTSHSLQRKPKIGMTATYQLTMITVMGVHDQEDTTTEAESGTSLKWCRLLTKFIATVNLSKSSFRKPL